MSFRRVRRSKFRHIFGQYLSRDQGYDNIRITSHSWDSSFCAVNPKFLAIIIEVAGGGAFLALPLQKTGRVELDYPMVSGHRGPVLDISWSPFNDNVIASASEDGVVRVWQIPDGGLVRTLTDPIVELICHQRRVGLVLWHPVANNILLSAGADMNVLIWNVGNAEILFSINHPDLIWSVCWNWKGTKLVTTCKDKKIRIFDPRSGELEQEAMGHEGAKPQKAIFLRNGLLFTTGFSRMSERQYSLRDVTISETIVLEEVDTSNGILTPIYDPDVNLLYLCAKGDSSIRYFEITDEAPFVHYIDTYHSSEPQRGVGYMPKRGCDIHNCEIARFYKLHSRGFCEVITFTVPRKSDLFQDDLYPDTQADTPALSAEEWAAGKDAEPILMSLKDGYKPKAQEFKLSKCISNILDRMPSKSRDKGDAISKEKLAELMEEMNKYKSKILKLEVRVGELEKKLEDHILTEENIKQNHVNNNHHGPLDLFVEEV